MLKCFKTLKKSENWHSLFSKLDEYVCRMYAANSVITSLYDLGYKLFVAKKGHVEAHQLLICRDAFFRHC